MGLGGEIGVQGDRDGFMELEGSRAFGLGTCEARALESCGKQHELVVESAL